MTFEEFLEEWKSDAKYIVAHTSGSTGKPKCIHLSKKFVADSAIRTIDFFKIKPGQKLHSCVGADFIAGKMMAVRAHLANAIFSHERPSNSPLKDLDPDQTLNLVAVVPSQVNYIIENLTNLPKIENLLIGGSPIHPALRKKIAASGINAFESYGMTETASHIALREITEEEIPFSLLPGINIYIEKDKTLLIEFEDGTLINTNDLGKKISDKQFFVQGRKDNVIISGGRKINLYELEKKIQKLLTAPFLLTGIQDEKWGEKLIMIIEDDSDSVNESLLRLEFEKYLDSWEKPKEIRFVKELPRTENGKIKKPGF